MSSFRDVSPRLVPFPDHKASLAAPNAPVRLCAGRVVRLCELRGKHRKADESGATFELAPALSQIQLSVESEDEAVATKAYQA